MAKSKKKNKVTAGDLFGKLGKKGKPAAYTDDDEFLADPAEGYEEDAIDLTEDGELSDSDLDINALLKKYMPDYQDDEEDAAEAEEPAEASAGGVLSRLRRQTEATEEDEQLLSTLDSAFSDLPGEPEEDLGDLELGSYMSSLKKAGSGTPAPGADTISEYDLGESEDEEAYDEEAAYAEDDPEEALYDEELPEEYYDDALMSYPDSDDEDVLPDEEYAEDFEEDLSEEELSGEDTLQLPEDYGEEKPKKSFFSSLFGGGRKKAEDSFAQELEAQNLAEAEEEPVSVGSDAQDGTEEELPDEQFFEESVPAEEEESAGIPADGEAELPAAEESAAEESASEESASEEAGEDDGEEDIDPTDINLMVAFGLDKKSDKAKQFGDKLEEKQHTKAKKVQLDRPEYVDKSQTGQIRAEYKAKQTSLWIRLVLCGALTLILMVFENIEILTKLFTGSGKQFAGVMDPAVYPVVYVMISLQIMLLACFCAYDQILNGVKCLFRGNPRPETMTALVTLLSIVYSALAARLVQPAEEPIMLNFITAMTAFLTLIYAIINNRREMMNFRVVANKRPKHIVRRLQDGESECEAKAFADDDDVCDVMKIEKTEFIDGYFSRLAAPDPSTNRFMVFAMSASVALAVLFALFTGFGEATACEVLAAGFGSMMVLAPLSVFITFSYPFYRANLAAKQYDSAIIGEASLDEYSNASIISFDDKNVFPSYSVKVQNIKIYNNARIDRMLYYASSVFAYAGGPLQDVFEIATKDMGNSENVKIYDAESGFLAAQVDGVNIIFGSYRALSERGMEFPESAVYDDADQSEFEIMYMFREDKLVLKFYVKYVMDEDIDLILKQFSGSGLYVCVRTFDPNIDEAMIAKKLNMKRMPLKIVRYASAEEVGTCEEKVDSGLVTCGSPKSLLQVISYCGKVLHTKKTNIALGVLSVMIGTAILVLLLLSHSITSLNSLLIALYQLIWLIPMTISSRMFIR